MYSNVVCCCVQQDHIDDEHLANYLSCAEFKPITYLRDLMIPEVTDISVIRQAFQESLIPFRPKACSQKVTVCCGICTRSCKTRCVQDLLHRAYMYTQGLQGEPHEWPSLYRSMYHAFKPSQGLPKYSTLSRSMAEIVGLQHNTQLKERLESYGFDTRYNRYVNHPHKFDYSPQVSNEVDPITGFKLIREWPVTGLCPFAVSRRSVRGGKRTVRD